VGYTIFIALLHDKFLRPTAGSRRLLSTHTASISVLGRDTSIATNSFRAVHVSHVISDVQKFVGYPSKADRLNSSCWKCYLIYVTRYEHPHSSEQLTAAA
jgi:hypothetical protein